MRNKIALIDFDGTIVLHEFPDIGAEIPFAFDGMKWMQANGYLLILWTVRTGKLLQEAVQYCKKRGIIFYSVNKHPDQYKATSAKIYCDIMIDDKAIGCPLLYELPHKPFVDWIKIKEILTTEPEYIYRIKGNRAGPKTSP